MKQVIKHASMVTVAALCIVACGKKQGAAISEAPPAGDSPTVANATATAETAPSAMVQLAATQGNTANGGLKIAAAGNAVKLSGTVQGLKPASEFGFHFHEKGDCSSPDATSAGAHFNPTDAAHGHPQNPPHHAGDMLNVRSDAQGVAEVSLDNANVSLQTGALNDVLGKALVMHAKPDDYTTQPAGDSGDRIACGVIALQTN